MAHYLIQAAYTPEASAAMVKNPQNRAEAARALVESCGGRLESLYFAFGEYDVIVLGEVPDDVSAAAVSLTAAASGAFKVFRTTPLMTAEEAMQAMRKAGQASATYRPPTA